MKRFLSSVAILSLLALPACGAGEAKKPAEKKEAGPKPTAYLTPEKAGPDFVLQGEYVGEIEGKKTKLGANVVALGNHTFEVVFLAGGLPGEGYDGKSRVVVPGKGTDTEVTFAPAEGKTGYTGTADGKVLKGKTDAGDSFSLAKAQRKSETEGAKPPAGATVLFDGSNADAWVNGKMDERKLLEAGTKTSKKFGDFTLHIEFLLPFKPLGRDQDRGNSGIYIQDRYEVQVLDTFGHEPEFNGIGALYRQRAPVLNNCYPPLSWQTYDIEFQQPKWEGDKKVKNAVITVKLNGVVVQDKYEITAKTGAGQKEAPEGGPIQLQGHGNPVFYRNIWIVEK